MKQKIACYSLSCMSFFCFILITIFSIEGCRKDNIRIVDNIPNEQPKGFVEFYLSDRFLNNPNSAEFQIEIYKYTRKGSSRLFTEILTESLRIAEKPGKYDYFVNPKNSSTTQKVHVEISENKITPVKIDILIGKSDSTATIDTQSSVFIESFDIQTKQYFNIKVISYEPIPIELQQSINAYNQSIRKNPDKAETYFNRGKIYDKKGQYNKAITDFTKAIELNDHFVEAYNHRGVSFGHNDQREDAISDFNKALELKPDYAEAFNNRGIIFSRKRQFEDAVLDFNKAIEIHFRFADAYRNRGVAYASMKKYDKAISDYNNALNINPKLYIVYYDRAYLYYVLGSYKKALSDVQSLIDFGKPVSPYFIEKLRKEIQTKS